MTGFTSKLFSGLSYFNENTTITPTKYYPRKTTNTVVTEVR